MMTEFLHKRVAVIFTLLLLAAAGAVLVPYREMIAAHPVFAPYTEQSTLVLDAGHGGCQ